MRKAPLSAVEAVWQRESATADGIIALDNVSESGSVLVDPRIEEPHWLLTGLVKKWGLGVGRGYGLG